MVAGVTTLPAPIGGLNAYDSLAGMPETDAIALVNLFPQNYGLYLRRGYSTWATGLGASVNSLYSHSNTSGVDKLYAWAGTSFFDATSQGAVGAAIFTGLTANIPWQATSFANSAGAHMVAFNGSDDGIWVSGAGNQRLILGDGIVNATWKNVDPKNLIDVTIHQRRIWAVEKNTTYGWYLPPDQVYGVAVKFDFGPMFKHGGYLQSLATWTVDDGDGADDILVAISSMGDVAVYKGIDPSSAATWACQGVYFSGEPVSGRRFHTKVAGDLKFMTQQGLVSLNDMLTSTKVNAAQSTIESRLVQAPLAEAATLLGSSAGWDIKFVAALNMLLINIPSVSSQPQIQFVENVINGKWCEFNGYAANCFADYQNLPFYGGTDGIVYRGWYGHADNVTAGNPAGTPILGVCQQAYSYFGAPAVQKQVGMYRPNFLVESDLVYGSAIAYDFAFKTPEIVFSPGAGSGSRWDSSLWDTALWGGSLKTQRQWSQASGMGVAGSICIAIRSNAEALWVSTDLTVAVGSGVF